LEGQRAAEQVGTGGYFAGGMVSGVFPGLIGTGIAYAVAATSDVQIPATTQAMIASNGSEYVLSYEQAIRDRVKASRKSSALTGGLLGSAVAVMIHVTAVNRAYLAGAQQIGRPPGYDPGGPSFRCGMR